MRWRREMMIRLSIIRVWIWGKYKYDGDDNELNRRIRRRWRGRVLENRGFGAKNGIMEAVTGFIRRFF